MAREVVIEVKLLEENKKWLEALLKFFEDPELKAKLGVIKGAALRTSRKSLKKTIEKLDEVMK